jgi:chromosomal replication initiator protein
MHDGVLQLDLPRADAPWSPSAALPAFVAGSENALVLAPIQRLLDGHDLAEAARLFNPLLLVGPSGSGKSQLAHAIVRSWRGRLDASEVAYFTAADFGRELQSARADDRLPQWRSEIGRVRLLVVEGLERLRRGASAYQELRQACDATIDGGGLVVFTADREPALLTQFDRGLRDRLAAGLTVRLAAPGLAARRAILRLAAQDRGVTLSDGQLNDLARAETADAAQLLSRLDPDHQDDDLLDADVRRSEVALKQILAVAARYFAVTQAALVSHSRRQSLVIARNAVVYLARRLTTLSYAQIGRGLGNRDHTTIMHAQQRLAAALPGDPTLQQTIDELERILSC